MTLPPTKPLAGIGAMALNPFPEMTAVNAAQAKHDAKLQAIGEKMQADVLVEREIREAREDYNARRIADRLDRIEEQGDGTAFADRTTPVDC